MTFSPPEQLHDRLTQAKGKAYLLGAGPGDPQLLTLKGKWVIENADVIFYDYLVDSRLKQWAKADTEWIYVGKSGLTGHTMSQSDIEAIMVEACATGKTVCRLKGGDPYVFGRGGEEGQTLRQHGIDFEVIPGITSAIAVPAYAGIPVTHREHVSNLTILTGHEDPEKPDSAIDWANLAQTPGTLVMLMGVKQLAKACEQLIAHGKAPDTPIALIQWGTRPYQKTVTGTLTTIVDIVTREGLEPPCVTIIGDVVSLRDELNWFERLPLFGQSIVVTRAREQASQLRVTLEQLGANVIECPTIEIADNPDKSHINKAVQALDSYDWLVLTSPKAVSIFIEALLANGKDTRALAGLKVAVIGPATQAALKNIGIVADVLPEKFVGESLFEALKALGEVDGKRYLLPRANIARDTLRELLEGNGAQVDDIALYLTVPPDITASSEDTKALLAALRDKTVDIITFTSASTAHNLKDRIASALADDPKLLDTVQLASIGPITSDALKQCFGRVDIEASIYTIPGLVSSLLFAREAQTALSTQH